MGKGRRPLYSLWQGQKLGYVDARKQIYLPLYRDLVRHTPGFGILKNIYREGGRITLFDFDGYDHHKLGMSLNEVLNNPNRICGHAFILAMMLSYGENFVPERPRSGHRTALLLTKEYRPSREIKPTRRSFLHPQPPGYARRQLIVVFNRQQTTKKKAGF
jgi:hypothetical protein